MMRFFILSLLCLCLLPFLIAQECLPNPGPALFFEDFGSGDNFGLPLPDETTTYTHGSIEDDHYVRSNTCSLQFGVWHDGFDHTEGDTDGYMIIYNASEEEGVFYQKTFTDLCPNTDYIFSSYIANIQLHLACIGFAVNPDVQFTVIDPSDETIVASSTTGQILFTSLLTWREFTIEFHTGPDQTTLLVEMSNNATNGICGNALAIDDISLRLCNVQQEQTFDLCDLPDGSLSVGNNTYTEPGVYQDALPVPNSCNDTLVTSTLTGSSRFLPALRYYFCEGDTLELADGSYTSSISFLDTVAGPMPDCPLFRPIEIIAQTPQLTILDTLLCFGERLQVGDNWYSDAGVYLDALSTIAGCDSVVMTTISTGGIAVDLNPSVVEVELGQDVQLMSSVSLSDRYHLSWQPAEAFSCTSCPDPLLLPQFSGIYQLVATDLPSGCTDSAAVQVTVLRCENVFVPNAFTPDFDGINDRLHVFTEPCFTRLISWRIFNRWGGLVYEASEQSLNNSFSGWDGLVKGQPAAEGVYGYQLVLERNNGTYKEIQGEVVLLK